MKRNSLDLFVSVAFLSRASAIKRPTPVSLPSPPCAVTIF